MTPDDLKARREQLGLSQAGLADALEISLRSLQNWEQGHRGIDRFTAAWLDQALTRLEQQHKE
jgi:DNA-binding transcriptional regulator YiaG